MEKRLEITSVINILTYVVWGIGEILKNETIMTLSIIGIVVSVIINGISIYNVSKVKDKTLRKKYVNTILFHLFFCVLYIVMYMYFITNK